jgi:hypothetical protein
LSEKVKNFENNALVVNVSRILLDAYYNCKDCESKFKSIKEFDEHMRKIHKPNLE